MSVMTAVCPLYDEQTLAKCRHTSKSCSCQERERAVCRRRWHILKQGKAIW